VSENAGLQIVRLPDQIGVAADYGLTVMTGASANAYRFAMFILSANGQRALVAHGFAAAALPK
jgi:molybdate transport system substrate-binding protein